MGSHVMVEDATNVHLQLSEKCSKVFFNVSTGCPKKIRFKPILEFLTLGRVFLGVKNNSKNSL